MAISETHNLDCLKAMREMPDKSFDLAIVDPEYGINASSGGVGGKYLRLKFESGQFTKKNWDNKPPSAEYFEQLFRVSKSQIIWGGNYFSLPPSKCFIVWDKGAGFRNRSFAECELAWSNLSKNTKIFNYDPLAKGDYQNKIHETQKPVALYKWLLQNYAKPGDRILDTHLGSGSSRIAAYDLGFDFVGFELDKNYFEAGNERFARHIRQPTFFESPIAMPQQEVLFEFSKEKKQK